MLYYTAIITNITNIPKVDENIPAIVELGDPRALLFHARDDALQLIEDTPSIRTKGWKRIQQFGLFFQPRYENVLQIMFRTYK
jgi:hypothetical protein